MNHPISRRTAILATLATVAAPSLRPALAQQSLAFSAPIGEPGGVLGDGFIIRHGFATENTWFSPGWWHTGEDWYRREGDTGGATVYAVADGEVVFADFDYPGRVVIVRHADDLYSMYGHLDYELAVAKGRVRGGQMLGTVLRQTGVRAPSHLHFEMRTFLTTAEVNGTAPRYDVNCGVECPPGPGYWPIGAPDHPAALGWRNPTHVIAGRAFGDGVPEGAEVVVASGAGEVAELWSEPADAANAEQVGELELVAGARYALLAVDAGAEVSEETSAEGYRLWYSIAVPNIGEAWVRGVVASDNDTGSDGRPSSLEFDFLPAVIAE